MNGELKSYPTLRTIQQHYLYVFDDLLRHGVRLENPEKFGSIYTVRGFPEVDGTTGSCVLRCVLVVSVTYVRASFKM